MMSTTGTDDCPANDDELRKMDAYWRPCNYLCVGMIYPTRESVAARSAQAGTSQESIARALGLRPRLVLHLGAPQSLLNKVRPEHDLRCRTRPWRSSSSLCQCVALTDSGSEKRPTD